MSQNPRSKHPLDVLQSMINGILIETGRALRPSDKEGGRSLTNAGTRLKSTVPAAVESFHQALDDLEYDIVRAKAVLLHDLEELRAKRIALENPVQVVEGETGTTSETEPSATNSTLADNSQAAPISIVKEEKPPSRSPEKPAPKDTDQPSQEPPKAPASKVLEAAKEQQVPTPPQSSNEAVSSSNPIGLGINTEGIPAATGPDTAGPADSATDSLFGIPDNDNNNSGTDFIFGDIDFPHDSTANTQNQELSQTQSNDFDLSTFGDASQDFNMSGIQTSADANTASNTNNSMNRPAEDLFNLGDNTAGADTMDLDLNLNEMVGAEDSVFDDIFFDNGDDGGIGGEEEMEHGDFDDAFFGLNN